MGRTIVICLVAFLAGAVATAAPCIITAQDAHLEEAAKGQETMGPGITIVLSLCASPIGGLVAMLIALWFLKRKPASSSAADPSPKKAG